LDVQSSTAAMTMAGGGGDTLQRCYDGNNELDVTTSNVAVMVDNALDCCAMMSGSARTRANATLQRFCFFFLLGSFNGLFYAREKENDKLFYAQERKRKRQQKVKERESFETYLV
jgi:hypothetical protein